MMRDTVACDGCGQEVWQDTAWPEATSPWRNAEDGALHTCAPELGFEALSAERLTALHKELELLAAIVNEEKAVPDRYKSTARGLLAEADAAALDRARAVVHRLMLWAKHEKVSPERYFGMETPDA